MRFTAATNPVEKDLMKYMLNEAESCPLWLPMLPSDSTLTAPSLKAVMHDPSVIISEFVRKQFFFKCFNAFAGAIKSDAVGFASDVRLNLRKYDL